MSSFTAHIGTGAGRSDISFQVIDKKPLPHEDHKTELVITETTGGVSTKIFMSLRSDQKEKLIQALTDKVPSVALAT